jgi:hypothetical protein
MTETLKLDGRTREFWGNGDGKNEFVGEKRHFFDRFQE